MLDYFVPSERFRKLTLFTAIVTYALVVIGGIVRVTGSGLGCLDWPFCTQPLPEAYMEPLLEMSHRVVAGFVTVPYRGGCATNTIPLIVDAVNAGATSGEICNMWRRVFGEYKERVVV